MDNIDYDQEIERMYHPENFEMSDEDDVSEIEDYPFFEELSAEDKKIIRGNRYKVEVGNILQGIKL